MNAVLHYIVLLKATLTSFAGLASLPVVRDELVVHRHVLTDEKLNEAVVITRSTPGPVGLSSRVRSRSGGVSDSLSASEA